MDALPVVIYDGACRFCVRQAARLRTLSGNRVRLESFRDPGVLARYPGLSGAACDAAVQLVEPDGRISSGATAVLRTLALRPALAPLAWLPAIPIVRQLLDAGYRVVARNRFRLGGQTCDDETCGIHQPREPPPRALVRNVFLRLLGVLFVVAFLSVLAQITLLVGPRGLMPAGPYLRSVPRFLDAPSVFHFGASDRALRTAAVGGVVLGAALAFGLLPRWSLLGSWALYLSFVHAGQEFFAFQWDNLLLESAFFALFLTPGGTRLRAPAPQPLAIFLMLWLVFRLHVESGWAKLLLGDPTWRDLTAMASYYETAPLPTPLAWWAHQMPLWVHRATGGYVYLAELGLPFFMWGPAPLRLVAFAGLVAMQVVIGLTANYGFFNWNSCALLLFVLDDHQLGRMLAPLGWRPTVAPSRAAPAVRRVTLAAVVAVLVSLSVVPFLGVVRVPAVDRELRPVRRVLAGFRSINAYHLFAQMTGVRREVVIEGSNDGTPWLPYEFRYKPGDPAGPPPFVAPHQPRVDFQLWFLLLGGRRTARYFDTLLIRLLTEPDLVRPLFARDPFPDAPPKRLRVAYYRYRFTDMVTDHASGDWWDRELLGYSRELDGTAYGRR